MSESPRPITDLQVEAVCQVAKYHCRKLDPALHPKASEDKYMARFLMYASGYMKTIRDAADREKKSTESWYKYWDRVWANKLLPGETMGQFLNRMMNPKTVDVSKIVYPPKVEWTPASGR